MPYSFEMRKEDGYILITGSGSIESMDDLMQASMSMHEASKRLNCRRFLVDEREVVKSIGPHDITVFADSRVDAFENRLRVAVVYTPEGVTKLSWMETFFQNRSLAYRQFASFEEAQQWLMS